MPKGLIILFALVLIAAYVKHDAEATVERMRAQRNYQPPTVKFKASSKVVERVTITPFDIAQLD